MPTDVQVNSFEDQLKVLEVRIDELSRVAEDLGEYYKDFLRQIVDLLGVGGAIWQISNIGEISCLNHLNLSVAGLDEQGNQVELLDQALTRVYESVGPIVLPGYDGTNMYDGGLGKDAVNRSAHTLLFVPVLDADEVKNIFLLITPPEVDPRAIQGLLEYLQRLCRRASDLLQRLRLGETDQQLARSERLRDYYSALHSGLDPKRTCFALANYAQELLGVYRCMAGSFNSAGKFRMLSVSGLESVAVKSSFIKSISSIARQVCRNNKALLVDNPNAVLAAGAETGGDDLIAEARLYMLQAKSLAMGVFPIVWDKQVVGALVVEKAREEPIDAEQRQQTESLLIEAGSALANGLVYRSQPLSWLVRPLARLRDKIYRMERGRRLVWLSVWFLLIVLPFIIPKQVKVVGNAELIPIEARIAYAQRDGLVERLSVPEDRQVRAGAVLASMDVRIVEAELDRVANAISAARIAQEEAAGRSKLQVQRLKSELKSLEAEQKKYLLERQQYEIVAPVSGMVITRQDELRLLLSRPVARGEAVITVVPEDTPWELSVNIPEDKAGQVLRAYDQLEPGAKLTAKVILNAYPDTVFETQVVSVAPRATVLTLGQQKYSNVIEVRVAEPANLRQTIDPREGLEGKVAIECGKRHLFFALTHEFVDFVRVSLF